MSTAKESVYRLVGRDLYVRFEDDGGTVRLENVRIGSLGDFTYRTTKVTEKACVLCERCHESLKALEKEFCEDEDDDNCGESEKGAEASQVNEQPPYLEKRFVMACVTAAEARIDMCKAQGRAEFMEREANRIMQSLRSRVTRPPSAP